MRLGRDVSDFIFSGDAPAYGAADTSVSGF